MITLALLSLISFFQDNPLGPAGLTRSEAGLQVTLPDWILDDEEVLTQFKSGLTNTFRITASLRGRSGSQLTGAARIEIRYELWDEVFLIDILEGDGTHRQHKVSSLQAFRQWWKASAFTLLPPVQQGYGRSARIVLDFIPFSQSEQDHARAWLTESAKTAVRSGGEQASQVSSIFQTIMATSIQSKPLWSHRWNVPLP